MEKAESTIIRREAIVERPSTGPQPTINEARIREIVAEEFDRKLSSSGIEEIVEAQGGRLLAVNLKRILSEFSVSTSKEVLEVDESTGSVGFWPEP